MKAIVCPEYGPVSNLEYRDMPDPTPGPGEVVIRAEAIGVRISGDPICAKTDPSRYSTIEWIMDCG